MNKCGLILVGAGGHARSCIDVIESQNHYEIIGLVGLPEELRSKHMGYEVIGTDGDLEQLAKVTPYALITIGQIQSAKLRRLLYQQATLYGFQMPTIVAATAHVARDASIGAGSIIMHGAIINSGAKVGKNCIINSRALVEHDTKIEDHCHISTGAILNGGVTVGSSSFIGSGCVVKEGITIGNECLVGFGQSVRHSLDDSAKYINHAK